MATQKVNYNALSEEWIARIREAVQGNIAAITNEDGVSLRKNITAYEIRSAEALVTQIEKLAMLEALSDERSSDEESLTTLVRNEMKLKKELRKANGRLAKQAKELKVLKAGLKTHG